MKIMCDCPECDGSGEVDYLHSDSREWGPDFREKECEECNGEGKVEDKCWNCGEEHEEEACEHCEGCEKCCDCANCQTCGEKIPEGASYQHDGEVWCQTCLEAKYGSWCSNNDKPCEECEHEGTCAGCEHEPMMLERVAEAAMEADEEARVS